MTDKPALSIDAAYGLEGAEAARRLYADWAATYDDAFAAAYDYVYPAQVAALYAGRADRAAPVLDVGAGTGLVGRALRQHGVETVDGLDLSPEMLAVARARGGYRDLIEADLLKPLPFPDGAWGGIVSAGTFTLGHLGPSPLGELARVAAPGALLVIGVNARHYRADGFEAAFAALAESGATTPPDLVETPIYGPASEAPHAGDRAVAVILRRL
ncbi:MAG: class I SAM-dependent methyltransferase [Rhodobacteraceae bacterium]|nr:MAG: class I SAM-dependent methyltransferase [Paracoccaceae bacterium]